MFLSKVDVDSATKPFQFFCEERHTLESLKEFLNEAYVYVSKEYDAVPSIGLLEHCLVGFFNECCVERYILRPDEEYGDDAFGNIPYIRELWEDFSSNSNTEKDLDFFLEWYFNNHQMFAMNQELLPLFMNDIVYILKILNLRFHNFASSYDANLFYLKRNDGNEFGVIDFDINLPICEVW